MLNKINNKLVDVREAMFDKKLERMGSDGKDVAKKLVVSVGTFILVKKVTKKLF